MASFLIGIGIGAFLVWMLVCAAIISRRQRLKNKPLIASKPRKPWLTVGDLRKAAYDMNFWYANPICWDTPKRLQVFHSHVEEALRLWHEQEEANPIPLLYHPDCYQLYVDIHTLLRNACKEWADAGGRENYLDWKDTFE